MTNNLFSIKELLQFNEMMLGRGMPIEEDGVGYNKADFGACATYFYGLSNAQLADLSKRLVKYSKTQLNVDKEQMKETAKYYAELANGADRSDGISLNITENGTLISFRYNETFIEIIKKQPKRQWDAENKNWIVPNDRVIPTLNELWVAGADVSNALKYAMHHPLMENVVLGKIEKTEVLTKIQEGYAFLKFKYNKEILDKIKLIPITDRQWNADFKFWAVKELYLDELKDLLSDIAEFKTV